MTGCYITNDVAHTLRMVFRPNRKLVVVAFLVLSSLSMASVGGSVLPTSASTSSVLALHRSLASYCSANSRRLPSRSACRPQSELRGQPQGWLSDAPTVEGTEGRAPGS